MMSDNFTHEQREAVTSVATGVAVTAGAGAGKTKVLVARYIEMLTQLNISVEEIVAITFTRKAANEMLERISHTLDQRIAEANEPEQIAEAQSLKEGLDRAVVGTIHSFCGRLLREYPVEAGVDPRFSILEDEMTIAQLLRSNAIMELTRSLDSGQDEIIELMDQLGGFEGLVKTLIRLYGKLRSVNCHPEQLRAQLQQRMALCQQQQAELATKLGRGLEELASADRKGLTAKAYEAVALLDEQLQDLREQLLGKTSEQISNLIQACQVVSEITKGIKVRKGEHARIRDEEVKPYLQDLELLCHEVTSFPFLQLLIGLLVAIDRRYSASKQVDHLLDFTDLEELTLRLLNSNPEILQEIRDRYPYLMVDEFQDTNRAQEGLVRLLVGERLAERLFIVGDPKQSIYRFRGAEVRLYEEVKSSLVQQGGQGCDKYLSKNFRTRSPIIDFVNTFFGQLMGRYQMTYHALSAHRSAAETEQAPVELLLLPPGDDKKTSRFVEADMIAGRLRALVDQGAKIIFEPDSLGQERPRPVAFGDMAILFRSMTYIKVYEEALRRYNIPYHVVGGRGYFSKQEVIDLINALKVINSEHDLIALFGWLRSPLVGISDQTALRLATRAGNLYNGWVDSSYWGGLTTEERGKLERAREALGYWRQLRSRLSVAELIDKVVSDSGWGNLLPFFPQGEQQLANLDKLKQIATKIMGQQSASLEHFLDYIQQLKGASDKETEASLADEKGDAVKLLTIHKSKGLEYGLVVVAELGQDLYINSNRDAVSFHPQWGLGFKLRKEGSSSRQPTMITEQIKNHSHLEERAENIRLLYVALTRARDYLIMSGAKAKKPIEPNEDSRTWLGWLQQCFDLERGAIDGRKKLLQITQEISAIDPEGDQDLAWLRLQQLVEAPDQPEVEDNNGAMKAKILALSGPLSLQPRQDIKIAVTPLLLYAGCPRAYYYRYRLRLQDEHWGWEIFDHEQTTLDDSGVTDTVSQESGYAVRFGSMVHYLCEHLHSAQQLEDMLPTALHQYGFTSEQSANRAKNEARLLINNYLGSSFFGQMAKAQEIYIEMPFLVELADGIYLEGFIDRILQHHDGSLSVIDYKTNKLQRYGMTRLVRQYERQLQLYALAAGKVFDAPVKDGMLYFLRGQHGQQLVHCPVDKNSLAALSQKVVRMATTMECSQKMGDFTVNRGRCHLCGYRGLCPEARGIQRVAGMRQRI